MPSFFEKLPIDAELPDGGPIYWETNLNEWIVEPYNALSAIPFIAIALYWLIKVRGQYSRFWFVSIASLFLLVGGVGGTVFHAFRTYPIFLMMDYMPIFLLTYAASIYFLFQILPKQWMVFVVLPLFLAIQWMNYQLIENRAIAINISYVLLAAFVLIPTGVYLKRTIFRHGQYVVLALISFLLAISFRYLDHFGLTPIGTHFLWHLFGAITCHLMFYYMYWVTRLPAYVPPE